MSNIILTRMAMKFDKYFFKGEGTVYDSVEWGLRDAKITDGDEIKFEMKDVEVPKAWSQLATNIFASKYCRKSGVPNERGHEWSLIQVVDRVVDTIAEFGKEHGYFDAMDDEINFLVDLKWLLFHQYGAFNSPVWFNVGLWHKYKIKGTGQNWAYNFDEMSADEQISNGFYYQPENQYERPQVSACFIQSVEDDLGSIFDLVKNEASIFKYGSGSGVNVSPLRGKNEKLSGGGKSSGLISFLEVMDKAAGAIKSGGRTRRAAALRALDVDHPEILDFINWKVKEEKKAEAMIAQGYDSDFNGEAYATISGQNSNNAVRLTDQFLKAVEEDGDWQTINRTTGEVFETHKARDIFQAICETAWRVADPGVQFDTTINNWHTCKNAGRQMSTNPCSEFSWINSSSCNLASLNLVKFWCDDKFDIESFRKAVRIFITAQDILVDLGSYPTKEIAKNSYEFRPLGLGYSNLGTLLMLGGYPYDSYKGRTLTALITSIMTGTAYETSAELAETLGEFEKFKENEKSMRDVISEHFYASNELENSSHNYIINYLSNKGQSIWAGLTTLSNNYKFRNAQISLLPPTGTVSLLMDCDTTGIEPAFSLVSHKKLAGGGSIKMVNQSVKEVLQRQAVYTSEEIKAILEYIEQNDTIEDAPFLAENHLPIFDCAMPSGSGKRFISSDGHIEMMAAVQPFLSGAISKTINTPNSATVQDIWNIFMKSWKLGLKAITVYRDGCKSSQPMNVKKKDDKTFADPKLQSALEKRIKLKDGSVIKNLGEKQDQKSIKPLQTPARALGEKPALEWGQSRKLPAVCNGKRWRFKVGGTKVYLRSGEYPEGMLGEIWIDLEYKEGSTVRALMNQYAILSSYSLQHGVSLETLVDKFSFIKFEPHGLVTGHPFLKTATSIIDAVFRTLSYYYLDDTSQFVAEAPPDGEDVQYKSITQNIDSGNQQPCGECGGINFLRTGTCFVCVTCGSSQGCS